MKSSRLIAPLCLAFSVLASAQGPTTAPAPVPVAGQEQGFAHGGFATQGKRIMVRRDMGKWWQDSQLAKKLGLSDSQIEQLNQTFYNHRLKLIDNGAEMEKADLKLQNLLDADVPNEKEVNAQVNLVLAARGALEREYTMMNLDLRKVLSVEQWRQLKAVRSERGPRDNVIFFKRFQDGGAPGPEPAPPLPPLPPGPAGEDMF